MYVKFCVCVVPWMCRCKTSFVSIRTGHRWIDGVKEQGAEYDNGILEEKN